MIISFLKKSVSLGLEIFVGILGSFLFDTFFALIVFFSDIRILSKSVFVVFLGGLYLSFNVFFSASSESLELSLYFLFFKFLSMFFDS